METGIQINNDFYNTLGERWYTAYDDPVALLRAETKLTGPWIASTISDIFPAPSRCRILDVGCGAGFLSNRMAEFGYQVTGIDLSEDSLVVARKYDTTQNVQYLSANAYQLPFEDNSFQVVSAMDFLEHVDHPDKVIREISRVLAPGGLFFFHTFNRNPISWLVIIKFVEWFVKNTPTHLHLLRMFIKPKEMIQYCNSIGMKVQLLRGTRPNLGVEIIPGLLTRTVPKNFSFSFTSSLLLAYLGYAKKML